MKIAYINRSRGGPPEEEQRAVCVAAGVDPAYPGAWYVEPPAKRNRAATFTERDLAIRALRKGWLLVIHSAPRLGSTEAEIRAAAAAVAANAGAIFDCSAAAEVRHHPDAGKLLAWAAAGAKLAAQERAGKALAKITKRGAPPKALTPSAIKKAGVLRAAGNSWATVAKELGVSVRTLYRHVPMKGDA